MVKGEDTGWLAVLEKKGLHQAAEILESYRIDSETDVSVLDTSSCMTSRVLKTLDAKELQRWCDAVRARVDHVHQVQVL